MGGEKFFYYIVLCSPKILSLSIIFHLYMKEHFFQVLLFELHVCIFNLIIGVHVCAPPPLYLVGIPWNTIPEEEFMGYLDQH